jgi:hypothetical protein
MGWHRCWQICDHFGTEVWDQIAVLLSTRGPPVLAVRREAASFSRLFASAVFF